MEIILLERVVNLGDLGAVVTVKRGFARFLIRSQKAKRANKENLQQFELQRKNYEEKQQQRLDLSLARHNQLNNQTFTIKAKASVDGKLFGSVTAYDIVEAIKSIANIKKTEVILNNGALKNIGEFDDVYLNLVQGKPTAIKINVVAG